MDLSHVKNTQELDDVIDILDNSFPFDRQVIKEIIDDVIDDNYCVYKLKIQGKVVATACWGIQSTGAGDLKLLAVHSDYRKKGYASYIVSKVLSSLKHFGCDRVYIAATDDVRAMWEHFGFEFVKTFTYEDYGVVQEFHGYIKHLD